MNAKRGYVPEDEKNFSQASLETMRTASRHIGYLINEGYDLKQASTFVGNHFLLSERQRLAIARSLATDEQLRNRRKKETADLADGEVWIDGFNTIITLEVMLSNSVLFDCMDGTIRDLAALRGTYRIIQETMDASRMLSYPHRATARTAYRWCWMTEIALWVICSRGSTGRMMQ